MKQYHRVHAEINIDYIAQNLHAIKAYVGEDKEVMVVIKADGYGHGAIPIARQLYEAGIDSIGVATLQEAVALRKYGIDIPILILGFTHEDEYKTLIEYNIIQTVYRYEMAVALSKVAVDLGRTATIHIKIDTGMTRLGFYPTQESVARIAEMHQLPGLYIEGLFTHFAQSDARDREYTQLQLNRFNVFSAQLEAAGIHIPKKHASNSGGVISYPDAHFNMVRAGIILYGLYPSDEVDQERLKIQPSLSLLSNVIFVKEVEPGTPISYGGDYVTDRVRRIATIPVGYGDGYPRSLSSKGRVLIRGRYAPIVGRVCMDQFMVDVTDIADVTEGDEAVLIGAQGDNRITVEEIAALDGTINYEIVCQLGKRIPRVYYKGGQVVYTVDYF